MECITKCVCSIVLSSCLSMVTGSDNNGNISIGSSFYVIIKLNYRLTTCNVKFFDEFVVM
jgi:hypothetical protein